MPTLSTEYITTLGAFARLFSKRIWAYAKVMLVGAIEQIIQSFVHRWQVEVTFHEVRTDLGVETQRQSTDL